MLFHNGLCLTAQLWPKYKDNKQLSEMRLKEMNITLITSKKVCVKNCHPNLDFLTVIQPNAKGSKINMHLLAFEIKRNKV